MSRATMQRIGSEGCTEYPKLYSEGENILTVLDPGHFMHGKVNTARYLGLDGREDDGSIAQRNTALVESIRDKGVTEPGKIWQQEVDGRVLLHVVSGTRRTLALRIANQLRLAEDPPLAPFMMEYRVNSRWTRDQAIEMWRLANQQRVDNDILTKIEGAALDIDRGVLLETAAEIWELDESKLRRALRPDGLMDAAPEVKAALATGAINLSRALKIAALPRAEQVVAVEAKREAAPKRKYITPKDRADLRALIDDVVAGKTVNPDRLRELAANL